MKKYNESFWSKSLRFWKKTWLLQLWMLLMMVWGAVEVYNNESSPLFLILAFIIWISFEANEIYHLR